jgi:hypothetical protein
MKIQVRPLVIPLLPEGEPQIYWHLREGSVSEWGISGTELPPWIRVLGPSGEGTVRLKGKEGRIRVGVERSDASFPGDSFFCTGSVTLALDKEKVKEPVPIFSEGSLSALHATLGSPSHFWIVDLTSGSPCCFQVFHRLWWIGRYCVLPPPDSDALAMAGQPGVIVLPGPDAKGLKKSLKSSLPGWLEVLKPGHFVTLAEGRLLFEGEELAPVRSQPGAAGRVKMTIEGSNTFKPLDTCLPLSVKVRARRGAQVGEPKIFIKGECAGIPIAAPSSFLLEPVPPPTELAVSVIPNVDPSKDSWDIKCPDHPNAVHLCGPEQGLGCTSDLPDRLAVILDQTCPDDDLWPEASKLLTYEAAATGQNIYDKTGAAAGSRGPQPPAPVDLNRKIREGLGSALRKLLQGKNIRIKGYSASESRQGGGMFISLEGEVVIPEKDIVDLGERSPGDAETLFRDAVYVPGLDVWDPIDKALQRAVEESRSDNVGRFGVLIVGNSPPRAPTQEWSPLHNISTCLGYPTTTRSLSGKWHDTLDDCWNSWIPVVYLFLEHGPGPVQEYAKYQLFQCVQREVRRALEQTLGNVNVIPCRATADGIEKGLQLALDHLLIPVGGASSVEIQQFVPRRGTGGVRVRDR